MSAMFYEDYSAEQADRTRAVLVVYGNIGQGTARITTERLESALIGQSVWLASRLPRANIIGLPILFYKKLAGFRGAAVIEAAVPVTAGDKIRFAGLPVTTYHLKLELSCCQIFSDTLTMTPLVGRLSFVSNKEKWGGAIRKTPRLIPYKDYCVIMKCAGLAPLGLLESDIKDG